jgi:hypothetical protein
VCILALNTGTGAGVGVGLGDGVVHAIVTAVNCTEILPVTKSLTAVYQVPLEIPFQGCEFGFCGFTLTPNPDGDTPVDINDCTFAGDVSIATYSRVPLPPAKVDVKFPVIPTQVTAPLDIDNAANVGVGVGLGDGDGVGVGVGLGVGDGLGVPILLP